MKGYLLKFSGTLIAALILALILGYLYFFQIRKPGEYVRQRVFPAVNVEQIDEIELKYPSYTLVCRKEEEKWFIFEDTRRFKADDRIIYRMTKDISQMKIEKVISENANDLSGFGLDKPEVEVNAKTPKKKYRVLIGTESPTGSGVYIRVDNDSRVILVNRDSVEGFLIKSVSDLRDRRIISLRNVSALEIEKGNIRISIIKRGNNWEVEGDKSIRVSGSRVQDLLEGIEGLEIEKFVDDNPSDLSPYGLDKPETRIVISDADKKKTLLFGKRENGKVYAKIADEKSVYLVGDEIISKIPSSKEGLSGAKEGPS
ncbi:MAG: hypothetical protein C4291_09170 [Candidatus Dadabacteria bacterium]